MGRDGGADSWQGLLLASGENAAAGVRAAAEKMVLPDGFTAAVHVHGSPGQGPGLGARDLADVLDSLGLARQPLWLVSCGAADGGGESYAQQFAAVWGEQLVASRGIAWVRLDGVVAAASQEYSQDGLPQLRPVDPADGQHLVFFPGGATAPLPPGPVLPSQPPGTAPGAG